MTDRELRDLLTDAVADVEPGHALDEIRARTTTTRRRWPYAAGGAVLAVAASFAAFAVLGPDNAPRATDPGSSTTPSATATETPAPEVVPVYFVGDTPDGPRLYREFQQSSRPESPGTFALQAALSGDAFDPDYSSLWPEGTTVGPYLMGADLITIDILGAPRSRPEGMSPAEAGLAIEQLVYTAQAVYAQGRVPVQLNLDGGRTDQILGVPVSEPLANGPVLATLAHVSLTTPTEWMLVDNDEPLVVEGVGNSFEGNIVTRLQRLDGSEVLDPQPTIAGWLEDRLFPWQVTLDLTDVPPADYVVVSQTDDPSGEGRFHTDSRRITIVD